MLQKKIEEIKNIALKYSFFAKDKKLYESGSGISFDSVQWNRFIDELITSQNEIKREAFKNNLWSFAEHWNSIHNETQITVKELEAYSDLTQQSLDGGDTDDK